MSRDKRGYDLIYLIWDQRRRGRPEPRLLYCCRLPAPLRVGPPPFDDEVRRRLEEAYPEIPFDWAALLKSLLGAVTTTPRPLDPPHAASYRTRRVAPSAAPVAVSTNGHRGAPAPLAVPARSAAPVPVATASGRGPAGRGRSPAPYSGADGFRSRPDASPSRDGWLRAAPVREDSAHADESRAQSEPPWSSLHIEVSTSITEDIIVPLPLPAADSSERGSSPREGGQSTVRPGASAEQDTTFQEDTEGDAGEAGDDDDAGEAAVGEGQVTAGLSAAERTRRRRRRRRAGRSRDAAIAHESGGAAATDPLAQRARPVGGNTGSDSD